MVVVIRNNERSGMNATNVL